MMNQEQSKRSKSDAKLQTPALGSVWLVEAVAHYEGSYIIAVYADEGMAERRKDRIEASHRRYECEHERWEASTENLTKEDEWPDFPKTPDHQGYDIVVSRYRVIPSPKHPSRPHP